ncbi:Acetyl esterase/lipase [Mariniphaga anaerophila]|uniref:Acetyl esterase/lipase n=1 Tax=Mariniphaga anaerophila TaxID=1484053 RepID=A0A1M4U081_9BACT|nr:alpha/beta hydrolase [Mariniphaga anaerophila]SHE50181.1 Acetyl esterase/lipase [Mariniphaga anaerophila]
MKTYLILLFGIFVPGMLIAQTLVLKVWPDGSPNDNGIFLPEEAYRKESIRNISEAEIYVYLPEKEKNTGAALIICPGGGYSFEAIGREGHNIAKFFQGKGIAGIVLKYRLPNGNHNIPSDDARRAMRIVRKNAEKWGIRRNKIGIMGSSAGGHLASTVGTIFDEGDLQNADLLERESCRPDFLALLYPVITLNEEFGHMGTRDNLIGQTHNLKLIRQYSNELNVSPLMPPTFIILADNDKTVQPRNSIEFYSALRRYDVPCELHIFQKGGHGFGIRNSTPPANNWPDLFISWLKIINIIE